MHRALPGDTLLLGLLILMALSGGCVALYTLSEAADPPPSGPDSRIGLPLFPPGGSMPSPIPSPGPIATETLPPWVSESDGAPYVPPPDGSPVAQTPPPWTWAPAETQSATVGVTPSPSEPAPLPTSMPTGELLVDDGMPGRDEIYHPIVTAMPPL